MSRVAQAISFLLLGAVAAGGGAGFFLYRANADRSALIAQAQEAAQKAEAAARTGQAVADEANRKLEEASQKVAKAQERVRALEEERDWFKKAEMLTASRATTYWKEWLNYTHGFSVRLPTNTTNVKNNADGLDAGWIVIRPYTGETFPLETAYAIGTWLLVGNKTDEIWTLRAQSAAKITHVVYIYPNARISEKTILDALSTFTFRDE